MYQKERTFLSHHHKQPINNKILLIILKNPKSSKITLKLLSKSVSKEH